MDPLKHTMKIGSLVRLASNLLNHTFITEETYESIMETGGYDQNKPVNIRVSNLDIGLVVDDLIEEEEERVLLVLFNEKIVRADCRLLRRVK